ncbi:tRNA-modifying protein YgfZ [Shewanella sp. OMA3-2]|uniref:tRNA-modifying protein YgfZ n=1 Tax=Shewanella sp. OMA3-2 TaxID=2908650 RepID=UPI001F47839A|nr:tRNA-modifying protein YgfZ [Shewanella sp. OMA3-2]UJF21829.1 tRNA-modifying protein YgfZ [Shewanella sp. OMA3-2]
MSLSISQPDWAPTQDTPAIMLANLNHLGLIEVTGEQGRIFINGQVTTDITSLTADQWRWGAHCDAKGKMLASFRTFALQDSLFMLMPTSALAIDLPQLKKYSVFSKAELVDASANWQLIGIAGSEANVFVKQHFAEVNPETASEVTVIEGGLLLKDGQRFIAMLSPEKAQALCANQTLYSAAAWQALEIKSGYPNIPGVHANQYVPQMCNVQSINGISFTKGCYMGQETIARMKYRGGNKRALYILSGTSSQTLTEETALEIALEGGYRRGGAIIEFVQQGNQVLLTAVLANDTEADATLRIAGDEESALTIIPLPYLLDN